MAYFFQPDLSGLLVQAIGALLMAALSVALLRTMHRPPLVYWSYGWVALFVSLGALWAAFYFDAFRQVGQVVYLFGEYVFGYLVIVGCRSYAFRAGPTRREAWLIVPALGIAVALTLFAGGDVNVMFAIHSLTYPYLFFRALQLIRSSPVGATRGVGLRLLRLSLLLLTIDYLHYAPFFLASSYQGLRVVDEYLTYAPLYDLIFQVMLMFGMVMAITGEVQHELESANADLERARDQLETKSRVDPLTAALNRRAFAAVMQERTRGGRAPGQGVVAVVDLDGLKVLNDRYGHAAGDVALQALAEALRAGLGPGDLLFRWGGDEFVVLFDRLAEGEAAARLSGLDVRLRDRTLPGPADPVTLSASIGLAPFDDRPSLDSAVARADQAMYRRKRTA
jgi:diguanylate cyclase (GGDEF)-like protein